MIIKRRLFSKEHEEIPSFVRGETDTGRRYVVPVVNGRRKSRIYLDPYRKRTIEELEENV